ncbi:MAG: homoprotocatechuate degradation operon regulator HpaR [Comamonas sp.]
MKTTLKHRNLPSLLLQARESIMGHTRPFLRSHGLSDQQWRVLRVLGNGLSLETGRVAKEAFLLGPSLTGVLARMERDGLIVRKKDPADQRRSVVSASPKGLQLVERLSKDIAQHYSGLETAFGKDKLETLYSLLDELIALERS